MLLISLLYRIVAAIIIMFKFQWISRRHVTFNLSVAFYFRKMKITAFCIICMQEVRKLSSVSYSHAEDVIQFKECGDRTIQRWWKWWWCWTQPLMTIIQRYWKMIFILLAFPLQEKFYRWILSRNLTDFCFGAWNKCKMCII